MADAGESYREDEHPNGPQDYDSTDFYNKALSPQHPSAYDHEGNDLMKATEILRHDLNYNADPKNRFGSVSYVGAKSGEALKAGGFFRRNYKE